MTNRHAKIGIPKGWSEFGSAGSSNAGWLPFLAIIICAAAGVWSIAMGPDNNWDLRYYHLYAPWAYLHGRYLYDIAPAQSQGFFNPTADFLFYAQISSKLNEAPRLIAFIMGAVHGFNAVLILAVAVHVVRPRRQWERTLLRVVAFLIGASGAGFISLLGTTTNDPIPSIFVLASLLRLLKIEERMGSGAAWSRFAWPGVFAGIGLGLKFTAAIFLPGLTLVALIVAARHKTVIGLLTFTLVAMLGFLAVAGHHLLTLWLDFGSPVYPLLNNIFQSSDYEPVSLRDTRFVARDFGQLLAYPFYWTRTNTYLVSELAFRDWRGAIAYIAGAAGVLVRAAAAIRKRQRQPAFAHTRGLDLVLIFVAVSYLVWAVVFGIYRYAIVLELLTGIVAVGALMWVLEDFRMRTCASVLMLAAAALTTIYPDWGHGMHPSAGIRPAQFGGKYIDIHVPSLPTDSLVLIATSDPVAYFIPFAEPTARYLGIENNLLSFSQDNKLVAEVKRLMRTSGPAKFILNVGAFDGEKLNRLLAQYQLRLDASPCRPIRSNLEEHVLSLCLVAPQ
jgi:Glycosyltransferase family 87